MHILLCIIVTVLLIEISSYAGCSTDTSSPINIPGHGEIRLSTIDNIRKLNVYGMYVSSVEIIPKDVTGKIFIFEKGKLLVSQEIDNTDHKFIFNTIGKLKNHHIHVSSLKYVQEIKENGYQYLDKGDASNDKLEFEKGRLKILFLKKKEGKKIEVERECKRDGILDWLEVLNDRGLFVSSFSCFEKATLKFENGHLTLPFASKQ
ncbi:MAG: hypothetical protein E3K40_06245 [Candidatus Brocadia sp.]|nr:hypothetical protein [Candidatus Brocadia sp.]